MPVSLESVPACVASFSAYLRYLNERREGRPSMGAEPVASEGQWVVALDRALEQGRPVAELMGGTTAIDTAPAQDGAHGRATGAPANDMLADAGAQRGQERLVSQ